MSKETELKIIERLKSLSKKLKKTPTRREYLKEYGNPEFKNYGGYNAMLAKAGLIVNHHVMLTDDEIKSRYIEYIKLHGVPKSNEIPKSLPSYDMICTRFGTYKEFLKSIGYDTYRKEYTKEELIKILQDGIDNGTIKSMFDLNNPAFPTHTCFYKAFGVRTWKEVLIIAGRKLESTFVPHTNYNFTQEELKEKYIELSEKLCKVKTGASSHDVRKYLGFTEVVFFVAFKKRLTELRREWGYTPRKSRKVYTKEIVIEALETQEKKIGRKLTLREITSCKELPALATIYRLFKTTSINKVYEEVEKYKK